MKFKNINKLLTIGILLNNFNLNIFADTLSSDGRYETFIGDKITVNDILENDKADIKINGDTLVNIWNGFSHSHPNGWIQGDIKSNNIQGDVTIFNFSSKPILFELSFNDGSNSAYDYYSRGISVPSKDKVKVNVLSNETFRMVQGQYAQGWSETPQSIDEFNNSIVILKGDYSQKDVDYFKGMKSGFENQLITQEMINRGEENAQNLGKYKVEIKSTSKNILPNNFVKQTGLGAGSLNGQLYPSMFRDSINRCRSSNLIQVKPNTKYTINCTDMFDFAIIEFDKDKRQIIDTGWVLTNNNRVYTTSNNCEYIILVIRKIGSQAEASDDIQIQEVLNRIQFEEGEVQTPYEPHKESTHTFYLNSPLLKGDTIEFVNGQATHIRRYNQVKLDGSNDEPWTDFQIEGDRKTLCFAVDGIKPDGIFDGSESYSNEFMYDTNKPIAEEDFEHHRLQAVSPVSNRIYIWINKSRLSTENLNGFKLWLQNNPVSVVYKMANTIYEPVNTDLSVDIFKNITHILNNSDAPIDIEVTVDRTINRAAEAIDLAQDNPTIDNLSQARYWSNLLNESSSKDYLQSIINSINSVDDLGSIEPIKTSSNSDIYIKGKNTLSLSLDTNNIVFEDVDGTEDMELLKAINLTVSSSLPYDVKSTLATNISNSDKSVVLDPMILNIKSSSANNYQSFASVGNELILMSNESSGTNKIHSLDLMLNNRVINKVDVYKTTIKLEVVQK